MEGIIKRKGVLLAASAAMMWALSGIVGQLLFQSFGVSPEWLVTTRMLFSGILLLLFASQYKKINIFSLFKSKKNRIDIFLFATVGMFGVQYTFFKTIATSSAAIATILQFTGPIFIALYVALLTGKMPSLKVLGLLFLTFLGVFLIVTHGQLNSLAISPEAFFWGIASALTLAFYTIQPRSLLNNYGTLLTVGWGMTIGGILANFIHPIWRIDFILDTQSLLLITTVIVVGTIFAYLFYLSSLTYITVTLASILTALEPILATIFSILIFGLQLSVIDLIGTFLVLGSILFLQRLLS